MSRPPIQRRYHYIRHLHRHSSRTNTHGCYGSPEVAHSLSGRVLASEAVLLAEAERSAALNYSVFQGAVSGLIDPFTLQRTSFCRLLSTAQKFFEIFLHRCFEVKCSLMPMPFLRANSRRVSRRVIARYNSRCFSVRMEKKLLLFEGGDQFLHAVAGVCQPCSGLHRPRHSVRDSTVSEISLRRPHPQRCCQSHTSV